MPGRILVDFAPLRESRDFRWLFSGTLVSTLGAQLTVVAIPYQVYGLTHSSFQVGAISVVQLVPLVVGSLVGGSIGDAVDRRTLMIVATGLLALTSGALAVNALAAAPSLLVIYLVSAVAAALGGFVSTARLASIPVLVKPLHLTAAYTFSQIVFQVGTVIGPALSGLLLRPVGLSGVYSIDACTYVASALTCFAIVPHPTGSRGGPSRDRLVPGGGALPEGAPGHPGGLPHRHQRHGLRNAQGAVPGPGRPIISTLPWPPPRCSASSTPLREREPFWARSRRVGSRTCVARDGPSSWPWWRGAEQSRSSASPTCCGWRSSSWPSPGGRTSSRRSCATPSFRPRSPTSFRSRLSSFQIAVVTGGPRLGDMEAGTVASLVTTEFAIVSGGLACIVGALVLVGVLPGFHRYRNPLAGRHHDDDSDDGPPG